MRRLDEAIQSIERGDYDAVLTDYRLGTRTGLQLLQELQGRGCSSDPAHGPGRPPGDLVAMDAGAADYLVKGEIPPQMLERSLRHVTQQHSLLMRCAPTRLQMSSRASKTGAASRCWAIRSYDSPSVGGRQTLLLFIDLDGMKQINDRLGHQTGDKALCETADLLRRTFRGSDVCARLGGDESAVLAVDAPPSSVEAITEQLRTNSEALNGAEDRRHRLSLSIGEVQCKPTETRSLDELLGRADEVMYEQKRQRYAGSKP